MPNGVKGEAEQKVAMLQHPDKTFTSYVNEIYGLLHGAWMPIFQMYADKGEHSWDDFVNRFGDYIRGCCGLHLPKLTVSMLRGVLNRMKRSTACGPDGWR